MLQTEEEYTKRKVFIAVYFIMLFFFLVFGILIYIYVRVGKHRIFNSSGRKDIPDEDDSALEKELEEIVRTNNAYQLELKVNEFSIGVLCKKIENNKNLFHIAAMYGALEVIRLIISYDILDPNELDYDGNSPLFYLVKLLRENNDINEALKKDLFEALANVSDATILNSEPLLLEEWQFAYLETIGKRMPYQQSI